MEVIVMGFMFYVVLFLALIAFIKNLIRPNKKKVEDLEALIVQLEHEMTEIKHNDKS
ncbi:hypothetical protein [Alteribacillus bidgolensis]|uniref:Uncharacterized protein n=1 Tax=Alteribacillus bidgolensis TaxID=930129 RepID=A0A1G8E0C7_9BACI|nr:hypothetical protein [Alteribacillus bidgolensis]SDH63426.1 hypothetical protein SAMN05216352_10228 [Alteribacillus bidgolensis]